MNYPGPFELRIHYTVPTAQIAVGRPHQTRVSLAMYQEAEPGDDFDQWLTSAHDGSHPTLDIVTDALVSEMLPFYTPAVTFTVVELWEYEPMTFNAIYRSSYNPDEAGSGGGSHSFANQNIWTFRTAGGGVAKFNMNETLTTPGPSQTFPTAIAAANTLAAALIYAGHPFIGRDNTKFFVPLKFHPGTNEALWKAYYRQ